MTREEFVHDEGYQYLEKLLREALVEESNAFTRVNLYSGLDMENRSDWDRLNIERGLDEAQADLERARIRIELVKKALEEESEDRGKL